jgi:hypothetical protein
MPHAEPALPFEGPTIARCEGIDIQRTIGGVLEPERQCQLADGHAGRCVFTSLAPTPAASAGPDASKWDALGIRIQGLRRDPINAAVRDTLDAMQALVDEAYALALRSLPREGEAQEAEWFRWLRDNPQAAAFTVAMVAKLRPHGPDLGATMNSGEVVGVMEDEKNPGYRYASSVPAPETLLLVESDDAVDHGGAPA